MSYEEFYKAFMELLALLKVRCENNESAIYKSIVSPESNFENEGEIEALTCVCKNKYEYLEYCIINDLGFDMFDYDEIMSMIFCEKDEDEELIYNLEKIIDLYIGLFDKNDDNFKIWFEVEKL
jgi:hypothetical protein